MLYEVNISADPAIAATLEAWLRTHIEEMLAIDGFVDAAFYALEPEADGYVRWTVHYRLESRQALEDYFAKHSERMRSDGEARFGGHFRATRRVLDPLGHFVR